MSVRIRLFGRFAIEREGVVLERFGAGKVQELFSYLLVYRNRRHARERLATVLWGDTTTARSKKHLRHVLWQLQYLLREIGAPADRPTLAVDGETVQFTTDARIWVDVAAFEDAVASTRGVAVERLDAERAGTLENAVALYRDDLLEGCYQEWCHDERERLQREYLVALDTLVAYHEMRCNYAAALHYGALSLRCDRAREGTHQRLMRIHYVSGDRAAALRQFDRCTIALKQELDVAPSATTIALYEQIRAGTLPVAAAAARMTERSPIVLHHMLERLHSLEQCVVDLHRRLEMAIRDLEDSLHDQHAVPTSRTATRTARRAGRLAAGRDTHSSRVAAVGAGRA